MAWLREGKVLLPGVTTLVELVATVRQAAEDRLYGTLAASVTAGQARSLEAILDVPEGRGARSWTCGAAVSAARPGGAWYWPWTQISGGGAAVSAARPGGAWYWPWTQISGGGVSGLR